MMRIGSMKQSIVIYFFRILPKPILSRFFGKLSDLRLPGILLRFIIQRYSARYGVNTAEMHIPAGGFRSFNGFFTRTLKAGSRVIDTSRFAVVSPVDARVDQFGTIAKNTLVQAKRINYTISSLLGDDDGYFNGGIFMTLYLSPGDYHRIHSPVDGCVQKSVHIPGTLFPVNAIMAHGIKGLFTLNERIITYVETGRGRCAVCKIGAMNVGRIGLSYTETGTYSQMRSTVRETVFDSGKAPRVEKGKEMAVFNLGSTVILLFPKGMMKPVHINIGTKICVGQRIGTLCGRKIYDRNGK